MQGSKINKSFDQGTGLQWIMKQRIRSIMQLPTKDQIYDNVSFKLGAFYKRFWQNSEEVYKQNTRKAGEIVALAENMQQISRQEDRLIKICAYARQVKKFQSQNYKDWKNYIWVDLQGDEKKMMEEYVDQLTPPAPYPGQSREKYDPRQKQQMSAAYKRMKKGMLLVEIFDKIWTIRFYRKNDKPQDVKRHQKLTGQILAKIKSYYPNFRGYLSSNMGYDEWQEIQQLW